jgi:hypothetical protein
MSLLRLLFVAFFISLCLGISGQTTIDKSIAEKYFSLFDQLRKADKGNLWGVKLPRKMLLIAPESYIFVSNEPLPTYNTQKSGSVFYGQYPKSKAIANTSVVIEDVPWTMVMWPLSKSMDRALELMAHESFHNLQHQLDIEVSVMAIPHMEEKDARILFRLEMNALFHALYSNDLDAIHHALLFRKMRFDKYRESKNEEVLLETQEGLAQYTGYKLAYTNNQLKKRLRENIENMAGKSSLSRATAYTSGPLYGQLLDASGKMWRDSVIRSFNAYDLVMRCFNIKKKVLNEINYDEVKMHYNFNEINKEESERYEKRQQKITMYTSKLIEDNPLKIDLIERQIGFNPNSIIPMGTNGNVYEYFELRDWFGKLIAKKGALMTNDWNHVYVSKPMNISDNRVEGDGWVIELKDGCSVLKTNGTFTIHKN